MSSSVKKLLSQVQQLCVDISTKPNGKYYASMDYTGSINTFAIHYKDRETGQETWICFVEEIKFKPLKEIKRKLKKLLEES